MATLYVVATPIGNLEDLTLRAIRILTESAVVAAESLTRTRKLLSHLGLKGKRLISCREINRNWAAKKIIEVLNNGNNVVLVSDSGTPAISDSGAWVVKTVALTGHRLIPVPGASALTASLSIAGIKTTPVIFLGFMPAKSGKRRKLLQELAQMEWPLVFFEALHRLAKTARDLLDILNNRSILLARELSKVYEEIVYTSCEKLVIYAANNVIKGEITLVIAGAKQY